MGLAWRLCDPASLLDEVQAVAAELAANPIPSLIATKKLMLDAGRRDESITAHQRELEAYKSLLDGPANVEAVNAFAQKRAPDFSKIRGI